MEELSSQKDDFTDQIHVLEVELRDTKNDRDSKKSLVDELRQKITAKSEEKVKHLRPKLRIFSQSNNSIISL